MSIDADALRRLFRFRLRTLLVALTVGVLAAWVCCEGWPRWQRRRQQATFEAAARQLRIAATMHDGLTWANGLRPELLDRAANGNRRNHAGRHTQFLRVLWPDALYVVFWDYDGAWPSDAASVTHGRGSIAVYRLAAAPATYQPQTEPGREIMRQARAARWPAPTSVAEAYARDFVVFLNSDRRDDLGFRYEVIHSDPPLGATGAK